jgi:hypothetical protein
MKILQRHSSRLEEISDLLNRCILKLEKEEKQIEVNSFDNIDKRRILLETREEIVKILIVVNRSQELTTSDALDVIAQEERLMYSKKIGKWPPLF